MSSPDGSEEKAHTVIDVQEAAIGQGATTDDGGASWEQCARDLKDHDEAFVKAWKEEIDTLLVFAGLFSAVLTAFNVQSYPLLLPGSASNYATFLLLKELSTQLNQPSTGHDVSSAYKVGGSSRFTVGTSPEQLPASDVRLNVLWFCALVCSLASASMGILVKQWLNQYANDLTNVSRRAARTRQYRRNGLRKWHVINIMLFLPVLLQGSLVLFLAGLLELVWSLNRTVAISTTVFVALLGTFQLVTTVLPAFVPDCAYRSPQALGFLALVQALLFPLRRLGIRLYTTTQLFGMNFHQHSYSQLSALHRLSRYLGHKVHHLVHDFVNSHSVYNWQDRERKYVTAAEVALDRSLLASADLIFADDTFLDTVVRPCLNTMNLDDALQSFFDIVSHCTHENIYIWGVDTVVERSIEPLVDMALDLTEQARDSDTVLSESSGNAILRVLQFLRTIRVLTAQNAPHKLQRLSDVSLSLLSDPRLSIRRLAFTLVGFVYRWSWYRTMLDRHGVRAIVGYMESVRVEGNVNEYIAALHLLLGSVCCERMTEEEFRTARVDLRHASKSFCAFFDSGVWKSVRLEDLLLQLSQIVPFLVRLRLQDPEAIDASIVSTLLDNLSNIADQWDVTVAGMNESGKLLRTLRGTLAVLLDQLTALSANHPKQLGISTSPDSLDAQELLSQEQ